MIFHFYLNHSISVVSILLYSYSAALYIKMHHVNETIIMIRQCSQLTNSLWLAHNLGNQAVHHQHCNNIEIVIIQFAKIFMIRWYYYNIEILACIDFSANYPLHPCIECVVDDKWQLLETSFNKLREAQRWTQCLAQKPLRYMQQLVR